MNDYLSALLLGAGNVFSWPNILIPVMGTLIAMVSAFLPGIGGTSLAALLLLLTLNWEPVQVLLLFGALTGGATYMGSITAILFNIPGNASSAAAMLDGHAMARRGLPRTAIAAAATASAIGSMIGVVVLLALLPIVRPFILQFGPLERFLLGIWGLTTIVALPNRSSSRAFGAALLGLLVAMVGSDPTSGAPRWTFGSLSLYDGFDTVAVLLGFFTLSEVMAWRSRITVSATVAPGDVQDSTWAGIRAVFINFGVTLRSSILGTLVGVIPGVGGTVASFVAYGQAVQTAKGDRSGFGNGDIRGLIAPEAAVDAKDGGSLLPTLAFGLPGSESGVILLSVLMIHGFVPGLPMLTTDLAFSFTLILALLLSNMLTSVIGISLAPLLARLTSLRIDRIVLPVLVASLVTVVQLNGSVADIYFALGFGILGYLFGQFDWPRIPFVIAFVLGGFIENNLALVFEMEKVGRLQLTERPAALGIAALILISLVWMTRKASGTGKAKARKAGLGPGLSALFALAMAGIGAVLLATALLAERAYTGFALMVAVAATGLCALIALRMLWLVRAERGTASSGGIPAEHRLPLFLMAILGPGVFLFGLPVAAGVFTAAWFCRWDALDRQMAIKSVVAGGVAFALTLIYLDRVAMVMLPDPAILSVFAGAAGG
jgi:TctA family transporter